MIDEIRYALASDLTSAFAPIVVTPSYVEVDREGLVTWGVYNLAVGEPYKISPDPSSGIVYAGYILVDIFSDTRKRTESPAVIADRVYTTLTPRKTVTSAMTSGGYAKVIRLEYGVPTYASAGMDTEDKNLERSTISIPFKAFVA